MALSTVTAGGLASDSVTTAKIADDAVTGAKIENSPTIAANLTVSGTTSFTGKVTASGDVEGFGVDDRVLLDATDGSATDAGDFLVLNSTDGSANDGENILFDTATSDGSAVLSGGDLKVDNVEILMDETSLMKTGGRLDQQTVIEQGLAKTFISANLAAEIRQSFNISSSEDEGTGDYKYGLTNAFRMTTARSGAAGCAQGYSAVFRLKTADATTSVLDIEMMNSSHSVINSDHSCAIHGDLA